MNTNMNKEISRVQFTVTASPNELSLLPVKINGSGPYTFIFDTGASCCCIATELAKELKIRKRKIVPASGADGSYTAHHGVASTISIGKAVRKNIDVAIFDFGTLRNVDEKIDGIVGYNFLCKYLVTIDYRQKEVVLCK
jgi:predicted aspartyl protease